MKTRMAGEMQRKLGLLNIEVRKANERGHGLTEITLQPLIDMVEKSTNPHNLDMRLDRTLGHTTGLVANLNASRKTDIGEQMRVARRRLMHLAVGSSEGLMRSHLHGMGYTVKL